MCSRHCSIRFVLLALVIGTLAVPAAAEVTAIDRALLERSDVAAGLPSQFRMGLRVGSIDSDRTSRIDVWGDAEGRLLVQFLDPHERGKFLLQRDDGFWFIAPGARRPVRLDRSYRLWGAASLDEIVGLSYATDYELVDSRRIETASGAIVELELAARSPSLPYQRALYVVHAEEERPLRTELRLPSGKTARILEFTSWSDGERLRPEVIVIKDVLRGGGAIRVEFHRVEEVTPAAEIFELEDDGARDDLE